MSTSTIPVVHALTRAESPRVVLLLQSGTPNKKFLTAGGGLTYSLFSKLPTALPGNIGGTLKPRISGSNDVASLTGRGQIFKGIIEGISIQMIRYKRTFTSVATRHPVNGLSTSMAGMRPRTDGLVKKEPVQRDSLLNTFGERVSGTLHIFVFTHRPYRVHEVM